MRRPMEENLDGTFGLIQAIFEQAKMDYINARLKLDREPLNEVAAWTVDEVRRFLQSDWAQILANEQINYNEAIEALEREYRIARANEKRAKKWQDITNV